MSLRQQKKEEKEQPHARRHAPYLAAWQAAERETHNNNNQSVQYDWTPYELGCAYSTFNVARVRRLLPLASRPRPK